ncbi:MAG: recombination protein O N-terminal domain-containing protein [bacterium]
MSYRIYHTDGYIIDSSSSGESNKVFTILTAELGTIIAIAQGVRKLQSKLRYSLQDLSFAKFALVRGKDIWRITGAEKIVNIYDKKVPIQIRQSLARILTFIKRLSPGEAVNKKVFEEFGKLHKVLISSKLVRDRNDLIAIETLACLRVAHHFGYGTPSEKLKDIVYSSVWDEGVRDSTLISIEEAKRELSSVLAEAQL